uniref:Uncharacterized protein n=1 Tax=Rhizophora mucronata TaxID=61149 RepID=A0A2P2P4P0_RHIMU
MKSRITRTGIRNRRASCLKQLCYKLATGSQSLTSPGALSTY